MNDRRCFVRSGLLFLSLCVLCAFARNFFAGEATANNVGKKITPLTLNTPNGSAFRVGQPKKVPTVVVFLSFDCPVSTGYSAALAELAKTYNGRADLLGICINEDKPSNEVTKLTR